MQVAPDFTSAAVWSGSGARCRYVYSSWPSRSIAHSPGCGSLTLMIMSARLKISSALSTICAPAFSYISFVRPIDFPPSRCTITWWPWPTSSRAPAGVRPIRYSWFLISLGTPISIELPSRAGIWFFWGPPGSGGGAYGSRQTLENPVDVAAIEDQRRRQGDDVAGAADQQVVLAERPLEHLVAAGAGRAGAAREFDRADQAEIADVDDVRQPA